MVRSQGIETRPIKPPLKRKQLPKLAVKRARISERASSSSSSSSAPSSTGPPSHHARGGGWSTTATAAVSTASSSSGTSSRMKGGISRTALSKANIQHITRVLGKRPQQKTTRITTGTAPDGTQKTRVLYDLQEYIPSTTSFVGMTLDCCVVYKNRKYIPYDHEDIDRILTHIIDQELRQADNQLDKNQILERILSSYCIDKTTLENHLNRMVTTSRRKRRQQGGNTLVGGGMLNLPSSPQLLPSPPSLSSRAQNWKTAISKTTKPGSMYYVNTVTKEVQWDEPFDLMIEKRRTERAKRADERAKRVDEQAKQLAKLTEQMKPIPKLSPPDAVVDCCSNSTVRAGSTTGTADLSQFVTREDHEKGQVELKNLLESRVRALRTATTNTFEEGAFQAGSNPKLVNTQVFVQHAEPEGLRAFVETVSARGTAQVIVQPAQNTIPSRNSNSSNSTSNSSNSTSNSIMNSINSSNRNNSNSNSNLGGGGGGGSH